MRSLVPGQVTPGTVFDLTVWVPAPALLWLSLFSLWPRVLNCTLHVSLSGIYQPEAPEARPWLPSPLHRDKEPDSLFLTVRQVNLSKSFYMRKVQPALAEFHSF